jgi:hypothetical protein
MDSYGQDPDDVEFTDSDSEDGSDISHDGDSDGDQSEDDEIGDKHAQKKVLFHTILINDLTNFVL